MKRCILCQTLCCCHQDLSIPAETTPVPDQHPIKREAIAMYMYKMLVHFAGRLYMLYWQPTSSCMSDKAYRLAQPRVTFAA